MFSPRTLRHIAQLLILTFTSLTLQPLQAAVQADMRKPNSVATQADPYAQKLQTLNELLDRSERKRQRGEDINTG